MMWLPFMTLQVVQISNVAREEARQVLNEIDFSRATEGHYFARMPAVDIRSGFSGSFGELANARMPSMDQNLDTTMSYLCRRRLCCSRE